MSDTFGTGNAGQPLEKLVETQALSLDLREAVSLEERPTAGLFRNWSSGLRIWAFAPHVPA